MFEEINFCETTFRVDLFLRRKIFPYFTWIHFRGCWNFNNFMWTYFRNCQKCNVYVSYKRKNKFLQNYQRYHCVISARIRSFSDPYFLAFGLFADDKSIEQICALPFHSHVFINWLTQAKRKKNYFREFYCFHRESRVKKVFWKLVKV